MAEAQTIGDQKVVNSRALEDKILGTKPKEIPIPSEIRWATNTYNTQGDIDESRFGITAIGIGNVTYRLVEGRANSPTLIRSESQNDIGEKYTRLLVGYLGSSHSMRIIADPTHPFSMEDADRLNASVELASDFGTEQAAVESRRQVAEEAEKFAEQIRRIGKGVDPSIYDLISVMDESLKREKAAAPGRLEDLAKRTRTLDLLGLITSNGNMMPMSGYEGKDNEGKSIISAQYTPQAIEEMADNLRTENEHSQAVSEKRHFPR